MRHVPPRAPSASRRRRPSTAAGFTLVELAACLSVLALLIPSIYAFSRSLEEQHAVARWELEIADSLRTVSEALRSDLRAGALLDEHGVTLAGATGCGPVTYTVAAHHRLARRPPAECGAPQTLASSVESIDRVVGGVELVFRLERRPGVVDRRRLFIALGH